MTTFTTLPRLIALCGNPKAGKTTVQNILNKHFDYQPVNDSNVLRRFCIDWLGMTEDDVYTQEGKAGYVQILDKTWQRRDILGSLGNQLESMFGDHIIPFIACQKLSAAGRYSFGSCRKTQGHFFKKMGGVVIEVRRDAAPPSPYDFDKFDAAAVDHVIINNGSEEDLNATVTELLYNMVYKAA